MLYLLMKPVGQVIDMKTFNFLLIFIAFVLSGYVYSSEIPIKTIAFEASGEPFEGQIAVGYVILNRMKRRDIPAPAVCKAPAQFSCWNNGSEPRKLTKAEYNTAEIAWNAAKSCKDRPGWDLYCRVDCHPRWRRNLEKKGNYGHKIGNHLFWDERG